MMDPPWKLSTSQPSRGVAIQYDSLNDEYIEKIPVPKLQKNGGLLIIWAINAKYAFTINLMEKVWGYKVVDSITWIKKTINGKIAKGHGFYLQHAKETCLVGIKGDLLNAVKGGVAKDVIFSERRIRALCFVGRNNNQYLHKNLAISVKICQCRFKIFANNK